jgi:hypothetical protein
VRYVTAETAKARAPLDSLCHHLGIALGWDDHAVCPFHDDHDPSLYIWYGSDGEQRWWCQVCGFGGDQIDLLRRLRGLGFSEAVVELDRIADDLPLRAPRRRRGPRDPETEMRVLHAEVTAAMDRAREPELDGYMSAYAVGFVDESDADQRFAWDAFLRDLGWGVDDLGRVLMPHWDAGNRLTGAKIRRVDGSRAAVPGSAFRHLYPAWWPQRASAVLLTEGETDFAWAAFQTGLLDVRSIPRGAPGLSAPLTSDDEELVGELLKWNDVWLAFDADDAGDEATLRWREALAYLGRGYAHVHRVSIPHGHDLRSAGRPLSSMLVS